MSAQNKLYKSVTYFYGNLLVIILLLTAAAILMYTKEILGRETAWHWENCGLNVV